MKSKLIGITVFFLVAIVMVTAFFYISGQHRNSEDSKAMQVLSVNEVEQLIEDGRYDEAREAAKNLKAELRQIESVNGGNVENLMLCGVCVAFILVVFGYVHFAILRPFDKMKEFAGEVAKGNFDIPLNYERSNYFGEFTWAFDSMRREITKARACEHQAIENNKTVIATLSHDIKTPIASIRAYAEGLEANLDNTVEKRQMYIDVIVKKCDEVSKLTNDLFLHSLSDLDKLKVKLEDVELTELVKQAVSDISAGQGDVSFYAENELMVSADSNRLIQIMENLINNARKYAKTHIDVTVKEENDRACIGVRDYGPGIPNEDIPFIFDKFYRGNNCGNEQGSGLGLYIVKYIAGQMGGTVELKNQNDGFEVLVYLPCKTLTK
ncbi:MAG: HAMP domain-containing histidine kinase [Lachnospira sp.]|nr:HAMP domain-containing histidine kinase [Lachnospira sp.]